MKQIYSKIKKEAFIFYVLLGLFLFLLGSVITFFSCKEFFLYFLHPAKDLFETPSIEYSDGNWYTCDNNILYSYFASDNYGRYYITSTNDGEYFGFYVYNKDIETADRISDDTYDYLDGLRSDLSEEYLSGKGVMVQMDGLEKRYFENWFDGDDYSISDYKVKYYVYKLGSPWDFLMHDEGKNDYFMAFFGLLFFIVGICMIISFIAGAYKKSFRKSMETYGILESSLDSDMSYARQLKNFYLGKEYLIHASFKSTVLPYNALIWAYVLVTRTQHKLYGIIPTGTTTSYQLIFFDRQKRKITINVNDEDEGHTIIKEIQSRAPYIFCGFSDDLASAVNGNGFGEMVKAVEERRYQYQQNERQDTPVMTMNEETGLY